MSFTDQIKFTDGRLHETEIFGEAQTRYPFKGNFDPDRHARIHSRKFWIDPKKYVPKITNRTTFTNLLNRSDAFDPAVWTDSTYLTRAPDNAANPWDGATTVDRLLETTDNGEHRISRPLSLSAVPHCLWAILKPIGGRRYWRLRINDGTNNFDAVFDLTTGQVKSLAGSGATGQLRKLEDGYFLIALTCTPLAGACAIYLTASTDGTTFSYAGDTGKGCYLAQLQLEQASTPGPLILTAGAGRSVLAPDRDPEDIFAYLATEADQGEYAGGLSAVQREYARIPRPQFTYPARQFITKPAYTPPTAFNPYTTNAEAKGLASRYANRSALGNASYAAASGLFTDGDNKVYYPMKVGGALTPGSMSGGSFVVKRAGDTSTTLTYSGSGDADIAAALNALPGMISAGITAVAGFGTAGPGLTSLSALTGGALSFYLTGGSDADRAVPIKIDASSMTVSNGVQEATTSIINATTQQISLATKVNIPAHGLDIGTALAAVWGNPTAFIYDPGEWGSVDTDNIWLPNWYNNGVAVQLAGNYSSTYSGPVSPAYTDGTRLPRKRVLDTYTLPGVTLGIETPTDIVVTDGMQNPDTFLAALLTPLVGWQDYEPDGPRPWDQAPNQYVASVTQVWFNELV